VIFGQHASIIGHIAPGGLRALAVTTAAAFAAIARRADGG